MASIGIFSYHFQKRQTIQGLKNTIKQTADRLAHNIVYPLWNIDQIEKEGDLKASIGYSSEDEIGRVISSFNKMAQQLERNFKEIKDAHEKLQKSQETFSGFFNQSNIGMAISTLEKSWINVNIKLCDIIIWHRQEGSVI